MQMKLATYLGRLQRKPKAQPQQRIIASKGAPVALIAVFLVIAVLIGMIGGLGSLPLLMIIGGGTIATLLFFLVDTYGLMLSLFAMTFVIQGSLQYFFRLKPATWVAVGMAMLFFLSVLMSRTLSNKRDAVKPSSAGQGVALATIMFLLCFVVAMVLNKPPALQVVSGLKSHLPMFSVLLAFYWFAWGEQKIERIWSLLLIVVVIQIPVVLYQHLFIATGRTYDAIVGTFGGSKLGGGNSASMVLFAIAMMTFSIARWNVGKMSLKRTILISCVSVAIILLGEVKAAFVWVPFTMFWVLRKRIMRNVFAMVGYIVLIGAFMATTWSVYALLYWGKAAEKGNTISEKFEARGGYFFDPENIDYRTGEVGRGAAVAIWVQDPQASVARRLLGYGPAASKNGAFGPGTIAKRYSPLNVDANALVVLLWEFGIIGASAFGFMIVGGAWLSYRASKATNLTPHQQAIVETCTPMLIILTSTLLYNRSIVEEPTAQLLLMFMLASVVQVARFGNLEWKRRRGVKKTHIHTGNMISA